MLNCEAAKYKINSVYISSVQQISLSIKAGGIKL